VVEPDEVEVPANAVEVEEGDVEVAVGIAQDRTCQRDVVTPEPGGDPGLFGDMLTLPRRPGDSDTTERGKALLRMMYPRNLELARWLIAELESGGVFDKKAGELTAGEKKYLKRLNRVLLTGAFRMDKLDYLKGAYPLYAEKERIISDMGAAGYSFVREHESFNYHYFLEFKQP